MELRHIEAFVTAAATGNFTRAGHRLRLSQSAVSQQIRLLEREIGDPLFIRANRRVKLSRTGQALLPAAHELLKWRAAGLVLRVRASQNPAYRLPLAPHSA